VADIAAGLGVTTATVYRELKRGETGELDRNQRREYNPVLAQQRVQASFKRRGKPATRSTRPWEGLPRRPTGTGSRPTWCP